MNAREDCPSVGFAHGFFANGESGVKLYADRCDNMSDVIETQIQGLDARWQIWQLVVRRLNHGRGMERALPARKRQVEIETGKNDCVPGLSRQG